MVHDHTRFFADKYCPICVRFVSETTQTALLIMQY